MVLGTKIIINQILKIKVMFDSQEILMKEKKC